MRQACGPAHLPSKCQMRSQWLHTHNKKPTSRVGFSKGLLGSWVFIKDEDTRNLRLKSELSDLRLRYADQHACLTASSGAKPMASHT